MTPSQNHYTLQNIAHNPLTVLTIGTFDGVHLGHKMLLKKIVDITKKIKGRSIVVTFSPHPRQVLSHHKCKPFLLTSLEERTEILYKEHIDHCVIITFNKNFSLYSPEDFIKNIIHKQIGIHTLIIGKDHRFGNKRAGSIDLLKQLSKTLKFNLTIIEDEYIDKQRISSTKIRNNISDGNIHHANELLGYTYHIHGRIIHGKNRGKTLGYPTANLKVDDELKLIPANGVYVGKVKVKTRLYDAMFNIGYKPTFKEKRKTIEAHILDFNQDIYNHEACFYFFNRIRDEIPFENANRLKQQLQKDEIHARESLSLIKNKMTLDN